MSAEAEAAPAESAPPRPEGRSVRPRIALTRSGVWVLACSWTFILAGLAAGQPPVTALGATISVVLVWGWAVARSARAELEAGGVRTQVTPTDVKTAEDAVGVAHRSVDGRSGTSQEELRVPLGRTLALPLEITLAMRTQLSSLDLRPAPSEPLLAELRGEGARRVLELTPQRIGDAWLQGFEVGAEVAGGLFAVHGWVPEHMRVAVLPRHYPTRKDASLKATRAALQEQAGLTWTRRRGFGLEIRELRDHQPGDPFKHIAWRASARRGKLISREFESDLVLSAWLVVDASPSMFWGPPGQSRIDYAIEVAYNLAHIVLGRGDRCGLLVHDSALRLQVNPSAGRHHLVRIVDAMAEIPHMVHEGRTEVTERELVERVARWFEVQQHRHFRLPARLVVSGDPRETGLDEARLVSAAREALDAAIAARPRGRAQISPDSYARDSNPSILRAFCRHHGVPLPLDPTPRPGGQALGLEAAIHSVLRSRGGPHAIVILSDFYSADDLEILRRVALAARRRRHHIVVFCPSDPAFEGPPPQSEDRLQEAVVEVARLRVQQNLATAQALLRPAGVTFLRCGPEDVVPRLLQRLQQVA